MGNGISCLNDDDDAHLHIVYKHYNPRKRLNHFTQEQYDENDDNLSSLKFCDNNAKKKILPCLMLLSYCGCLR